MKKRTKPNPYMTDQENPAWIKADFARARAARKVVPPIVKAYETKNLHVRGRPKSSRKISVSLPLDQEIVAALRATGDGWQTRVNNLLKAVIEVRAQLMQPSSSIYTV